MRLQHCADLQTFYDRVMPFLQQREAEHNVLLGVLSDLLREPPKTLSTDPYMGYVETDTDEVVAVAHYAGHRLFFSHAKAGYEKALEILAADAASPDIQRLLVPAECEEIVKVGWGNRFGSQLSAQMPMRIYRLDTVIPVNIPGRLRWTTKDDRALIRQWMIGFDVDVYNSDPTKVNEERVTNWMTYYAESDVYGVAFWEADGQPVSMAATVGRSPTGMRIGLVYTPAEHRGHGYASAITSALSQHLLDKGFQFCTLSTDLANPTSNKIYQAIGYMPVADQTAYDVVPVASEDES
jgi:uncharacterized protein